MRRDLVLLSGGLDSSTALAVRHHHGTAVHTLSVNYGQRHQRELDAASTIAAHYRLPHQILDLTGWGRLLGGSALTDPNVAVPHGPYTPGNMATTVVPNRNATMLMAAAGVAQANDCTHVVTAVHGGDHHLYPDCRPDFIHAADHAAQLGTGGAVAIDAPFLQLDKASIVTRATQLAAPLQATWSCYEGGNQHCGACGTCRERRDAFTHAGVTDPTSYATEVATT